MSFDEFDKLMGEQSPYMVYDYGTGQMVPATEEEYLAREQYYAQNPDVAPPGTPGKISPKQQEYINQRQNEYVKQIFGNVWPQRELSDALAYADQDPVGFLGDIMAAGKNDNTVAVLKAMFSGVTDDQINQLFAPPAFTPDISKSKTGVLNYDNFRAQYFTFQGWNDYGYGKYDPTKQGDLIQYLQGQDIPVTADLLEQFVDREIQAETEYQKLYSEKALAASGFSKAVGMVLPASGKLIDPERPDINPTDIMFDVATVIPGLGYIGKAGNLIKNAALASKLVKIADTTSLATFSVAQGMNLKRDWADMTNEERLFAIGMTGATALGAGMGLKGVVPKNVQAGLKQIAVGSVKGPVAFATAAGGGKGIPKNFVKTNPLEFIKARNLSTRQEFLTPYSAEDLAKFDLYLSEYGKVGYAITPEKDLVNVFNNSGVKGVGAQAVAKAIESGVETLDCFDKYLPAYYKRFGFEEYKRVPWDNQYAPPNWNYEKYETPDIIYMRYQGGTRNANDIFRRFESAGSRTTTGRS
jgi:hypothetical protein